MAYEDLAALTGPRLRTEVPGPKTLEVVERDAQVASPSLPRAYDFAPLRGAGAILEDVDGNVFLDFNAGIAVCSTGHSHPKVVEAIHRQSEQLLHYSASDFYLPVYTEVCERLDKVSPISGPTRSFLTNSGTEAVEAAIKLARQHTGRQYLIAFIGSFHGRSYGSVSLTASQAKYHQGFGPMLPGVLHAPFGVPAQDYIESVIFRRLVVPSEIAAIFVEPVQGEGGYVFPPAGWLRELRDLCSEHGILLVADEVQSGMGRTGRMWAVEHDGVEPDIVLTGKGIASGLPLGGMTARADVMTWQKGAHGSTYGGNPLACAAALATIDLLEDGLIENAAQVGAHLMERLERLQHDQALITEVRGLGLMVGAEFANADVADAVELACLRRGLLTLRTGDSAIRISPPLVVSKEQVATGLQIFEASCREVAAKRVARSDDASAPEGA
ncbi:MAG: aminotransferase class III-fold pyridoxal phosphate-dependent enzyme [Actinomycetota bacterium]|nr:aminotransferase class III-fold pyridoxal phosphate-dependent enzyme [Actinomycetota bacterium]